MTHREKGDTGAKKKKKKQKKKNKDKSGVKDETQDPLAQVSVFVWLCVFDTRLFTSRFPLPCISLYSHISLKCKIGTLPHKYSFSLQGLSQIHGPLVDS